MTLKLVEKIIAGMHRNKNIVINARMNIAHSVGLAILCAGLLFSVPTDAQSPQDSDVPETHIIGSGESLYMIVATYYPDRMATWTEVAADMVELNPQAFPDGLDTSLKLGREIRLPNYAARNEAARQALQTGEVIQSLDSSNQNAETAADTSAGGPNNTAANGTEPIASRTTNNTNSNANNNASGRSQENARSASGNMTSRPNVRTPRIGVVMSSVGTASATSSIGQSRPLRPGDIVYLGDTVITTDAVETTIRLGDDSEYRIKPNSRLVFEHFSATANTTPPNTVLTLIEGSFSGDNSAYAGVRRHPLTVNTAVATIGVSNSHIGIKICPPPTCTDGATKLDQGLYVGVLQGSVSLTNNTGDVSAIQGDFYRLESPDVAPVHAPYAAPQIFSPSELSRLENPPGSDEPLGFWAWFKHWLFDD